MRFEVLTLGTLVADLQGMLQHLIGENINLDETIHFVGKPYTAAELTRRVREVLDS